MQAFFRMAERWNLSTDQQITLLGSPPRSTFFKWKKEGGAVPPDTVERLSHLLSIWKALQILFTSDQASDAWMHAPNDFFNGDSALDVMLGGKVIDIYAVRRYLDAQRGG
ncbi:antitoxin Xre/MbcA/ParS toxin-binding domain-containing protein [Devosia sp.]|uniref:MbcA/ParS/Xre antitoxin family protein n=1 Tax=Devosia sp. TaxID=1871048 RepID=UPI0035B4AE4C